MLRVFQGLLVMVALLAEGHALTVSLSGHRRVQAAAAERLRVELASLWSELNAAYAPAAEPAGYEAVLRRARASFPGALVEVYDGGGRRLAGQVSPVAHWVDAELLSLPGSQGVFVVGPFPGSPPHVLGYTHLGAPPGVILRLTQPLHDLGDDLAERRRELLAHAVGLGMLLIVVALASLDAHRRPGAAAEQSPDALGAYEAAVEHLRDREQRQAREHAAERRRFADTLREREALARAGELTAGMAHEVRNGLGTILGYARLLERGGAEAAAAAPAIRSECETLEAVVRRFMEYVRQDELHLLPFALRATLSRVAAREARGRPGAEIRLSEGPEVELVGDEALLERAFENVVRNAREAAGPGGSVEMRAGASSGWVSIVVEDDGPGLPEQAIQAFRSTKPGGLGLGLPLASKIVGLHSGKLELQARSPHGVRAVVRLPQTPGGGVAGPG